MTIVSSPSTSNPAHAPQVSPTTWSPSTEFSYGLYCEIAKGASAMFSRDASIPGDAALGYIHKSFVALLRTSIAGRSFPIPITREQVTAIFQSALSWYAWESADSGVLGGKRKQAGLGPEDATFGQEDVTHPCGESRGWTFEKGAAVSGYDSRLEQQENVHEGIESSREESGEESDSSVEVVFP